MYAMKRRMALLLALVLGIGNTGTDIAMAQEIWENQEKTEVVSISHELEEDGESAKIFFKAAHADIRLTDVKITKGTGTMATSSTADDGRLNESEAATASTAEREEAEQEFSYIVTENGTYRFRVTYLEKVDSLENVPIVDEDQETEEIVTGTSSDAEKASGSEAEKASPSESEKASGSEAEKTGGSEAEKTGGSEAEKASPPEAERDREPEPGNGQETGKPGEAQETTTGTKEHIDTGEGKTQTGGPANTREGKTQTEEPANTREGKTQTGGPANTGEEKTQTGGFANTGEEKIQTDEPANTRKENIQEKSTSSDEVNREEAAQADQEDSEPGEREERQSLTGEGAAAGAALGGILLGLADRVFPPVEAYAAQDEFYWVEKHMTVEYTVDDIGTDKRLSDLDGRVVTIESNIHGEGEGKSLTIPVHTNESGTLTLTYMLPEKVKGRALKIGLPKYVNITGIPEGGMIERSEWNLEGGSYYLYLYFVDDIDQSVNIQILYTTRIFQSWSSGALTKQEREQYVKTGEVILGDFTAQAVDREGNEYGEAKIGPMTVQKNTGALKYTLTHKTNVYEIYDNSRWISENPVSLYNHGWELGASDYIIYEGSRVPYFTGLRLYAPKKLRFNPDSLADKEYFITQGSDEKGNYLDCDLEKEPRALYYIHQLTVGPEDGTVIAQGETYEAAASVLTYQIFGEEEKRELLPMVKIKVLPGTIGYKEQLKIERYTQEYPNVSLLYTGQTVGQGGVGISNLAEGNILPESRAENAVFTVEFPYELKTTVWDISAGYDDARAKLYGEMMFGVVEAHAVLNTGRRVKCSLTRSSDGKRITSVRLELLETLKSGEYVERLETVFDSLYGVTAALIWSGSIAYEDEEGRRIDPYIGTYGKEIRVRGNLEYEGKSQQAESSFMVKGIDYRDSVVLPSGAGQEIKQNAGFSYTAFVRNQGTFGNQSLQEGFLRFPEHELEGAVLTMDYPYLLQPDSWKLETMGAGYSGFSGPVSIPSRAEISGMTVYFDDGSVKELKVGDIFLNSPTISVEVPKGRRVVRTELHIKKLYGCELRITIGGRTSEKREDGSNYIVEEVKIESALTYKNSQQLEKKLNASYRFKTNDTMKLGLGVSGYYESAWPGLGLGSSNLGTITNRFFQNDDTPRTDELDGGVISMEYPFEFNPVEWEFYYNYGSGGSSSQTHIKHIKVYYDDNTSETIPIVPNGNYEKAKVRSEALEGRRVTKMEAEINELRFMPEFVLFTRYRSPYTREDGSIFSGNVKIPVKIQGKSRYASMNIPVTLITPKDWTQSISWGDGQSSSYVFQKGENTFNGRFYINTLSGLGNHFMSAKNLEFKLDPVMASACTGYYGHYENAGTGWEIHYKTTKGTEGIFQIPRVGVGGIFYQLKSGERFSEITIKRAGGFTVPLGAYSTTYMYLQYSLDRAALEKLPYGDDGKTYRVWETTSIGKSEPWAGLEGKEQSSKHMFHLYEAASFTMRGGDAQITLPSQTFQTQTFDVGLTPTFQIRGLSSSTKLALGRITYYVEWKSPQEFVFAGLAGNRYKGSMVRDESGTAWLKIEPRAGDFSIHNIYEYSAVSLPQITVKAKVLPGTKNQSHPLTGRVFADIKAYRESEEDLRKKGSIVTMTGLLVDAQGICQDGDRSPRLYQLTDTEKSITVNLKNLTGVTTILGIGGGYEDGSDTVSILDSQRDELNALVSVSSQDDVMGTYTVNMELPRKGLSISYMDREGTVKTAVSEFDIRLRGPVESGSGTGTTELLYRMEGAADFVNRDLVGERWSDVAEVQISINNLPAKQSQNLFFDLSAAPKQDEGEMSAFLAPVYSYMNSGGGTVQNQFGRRATFLYGDYKISGKAWLDTNENGICESGEKAYSGLTMELMEGDQRIKTVQTEADGTYQFSTLKTEGLSVRAVVPEGMKVTAHLADAADSANNSDFDRTNRVAALPEKIRTHQEYVDVGLVVLPVLTVSEVKVKERKTQNVTADTTAPSGKKPVIRFEEAADTDIAVVSKEGVVTGKKAGGITTAKAYVMNSLGDRVEQTYRIRVGTNQGPVITPHDWVAVEGDTITDLWAGVGCADPDDTYPDFEAFYKLGFRNGPVLLKTTAVYTDNTYDEDKKISTEEALKHRGVYYIRYSAMDPDGNVAGAEAMLRVYGKVSSTPIPVKHYFHDPATISPSALEFYYTDAEDGHKISIKDGITADRPSSEISEGVSNVMWTAGHPMEPQITEGVTAGNGRQDRQTVTMVIDSRISVRAEDRETVVNAPVDLTEHTLAGYTHYQEDGTKVSKSAPVMIRDAQGNMVTDFEKPTPGIYEISYEAEAEETYENYAADGQPVKNTAAEKKYVKVSGRPWASARETVYVTPEQGKNENLIRQRMEITAGYQTPDLLNAAIPESELEINVSKAADGTITEIQVRAPLTLEGKTYWSDPVETNVVVREVPVIQAEDTHLRQGEAFMADQGVQVSPHDPDNQVITTSGTVDTSRLGRYQFTYHVKDKLTEAESSTVRTVYVHGIPVIEVDDSAMHTHEAADVPSVVKRLLGRGPGETARAAAYVDYTLPGGTIKRYPVNIGEITGSIPGFKAGVEHIWPVSLTVSDSSVLGSVSWPEGRPKPAAGTKESRMEITDKKYQVTFLAGGHGSFPEGDTAVVSVSHGKTVTPPRLILEEGYELRHWLDARNQVINLASFPVTADLTVKAEFKIKEYTVRFIGKRDRVIKTQIVKHGDPAEAPVDDRDVLNNRFDGWSENFSSVKSNLDVYALFYKTYTRGPKGPGSGADKGPGVIINDNPVPLLQLPPEPTIPEPKSPIQPDLLLPLPPTGDEKEKTATETWLLTLTPILTKEESTPHPKTQAPSPHASPEAPHKKRCLLHWLLLLLALIEFIYIAAPKKEKESNK